MFDLALRARAHLVDRQLAGMPCAEHDYLCRLTSIAQLSIE